MGHRTLGLILAGLITGAAIAALTLAPALHQVTDATVTGKALVGGPFTLTDHTGKRVSDKDFHGKTLLVFFGFTNCPDICPSGLQVIGAALDKLGPKADGIVPLFITFDAARDTPERLATYLRSFNARIIGLSGSAEDLAAVAKSYRVYVQKVSDEKTPSAYSYDHTAIFYIMGKDGAFVSHVPHSNDVNELTAALEKALS